MSEEEDNQSTEYCLNYHEYVPFAYNSILIVLSQQTGYVDYPYIINYDLLDLHIISIQK